MGVIEEVDIYYSKAFAGMLDLGTAPRGMNMAQATLLHSHLSGSQRQ
jgi:hypothetical protein